MSVEIVEVGQVWECIPRGERVQVTSVDRERRLVSWRSLDRPSTSLMGWDSFWRGFRPAGQEQEG